MDCVSGQRNLVEDNFQKFEFPKMFSVSFNLLSISLAVSLEVSLAMLTIVEFFLF